MGFVMKIEQVRFPKTLTGQEIQDAREKGFEYFLSDSIFILKRNADEARIWPHIDGYISAFIRQGTYVKHKKFLAIDRALDRQFSD